ncbi:MAG: TolC family protein [Gemmataceae bacterium]
MPLPPYELERVRQCVLANHPDILAARVAVDRGNSWSRGARVEPVPNVTVSGGYVRQNQNRSNDWTLGVSVPVPVWNRNQGNIRAAEAQVGQAVQEVGRVENELAERAATAFREFASARQRAERYRTAIVPKARETFELSQKAYKGGQFEYLRVLEAQRTVGQAELERVRALADAWKAASAISGLTLEQQWPPVSAPEALPSKK